MALPTPLNFQAWIDANRHLLKPPVGNKQVWPNGDFIVMVVGGPNQRKDYHINQTPEFFHQLEGDMLLKVIDNGQFKDIPIKQGEIFLLPAGVPHSPQRFPDTVGLVLEQKRSPGMQDGLAFFCESCGNRLYAESFELTDIETQFPPVFDRFYGSLAHRTCNQCGWVMPERA